MIEGVSSITRESSVEPTWPMWKMKSHGWGAGRGQARNVAQSTHSPGPNSSKTRSSRKLAAL